MDLGVHDLALFAATVFVLNATPGVDMALTVGATLRAGWRQGVAVVLGINLGCVFHTVAAAFGLAALLAASAEAFTVVKLLGAAYLVYVAWGMARAGLRPAPPAQAGAAAVPPSFGQGVWQGFLTNALNPKVALFYLALLPQFIDADAPHKTLAFVALGLWFVVQGGLFSLALVALTALARHLPARPGVGRALDLGGAGLFTFLAVRLALAERH